MGFWKAVKRRLIPAITETKMARERLRRKKVWIKRSKGIWNSTSRIKT
jgi:hypothetical protein